MRVLGIDPGTNKSAYVIYDTDLPSNGYIDSVGIVPNTELVTIIKDTEVLYSHIVIEMLKSYGNVVGDSILETCVWIGHFEEAARSRMFSSTHRIHRKEIVQRICYNSRAGDSQVRQAIIDKYGGKAKAIGRAKTPGPLYKFRADAWQALAVILAWKERYDDECRGLFE